VIALHLQPPNPDRFKTALVGMPMVTGRFASCWLSRSRNLVCPSYNWAKLPETRQYGLMNGKAPSFGVSAVEIDARDLSLHAHGEVPAPALCADETMAATPADAHALPWPPGDHVVTDGIDVSRDFMPGHTGLLQARPEPVFDQHVAVANATRFDFHAHVPSARLRNNPLDHFPFSTRFPYLRRLHCCRHTCSYS
jgi:hypothetical protein